MKWLRIDRGYFQIVPWSECPATLVKVGARWSVSFNDQSLATFEAKRIPTAQIEALRIIGEHLEGMTHTARKAMGE